MRARRESRPMEETEVQKVRKRERGKGKRERNKERATGQRGGRKIKPKVKKVIGGEGV